MGNPANQPPQSTMAVAATGAVHHHQQQQQSSTSITHFSHPHPLFLTQQGTNFNAQCSGCKQFDASSGPIYTCTPCNYSLHQKCSQMPQRITHPFDKNNHVLSLMTKPAYPDGTFTCDACAELGYGFNYRCETCGIDLHILCASSPMVITRQFHPHQLSLTFAPPYPIGTFSCDVCRLGGSKNWLYRCHICEFDVHLTCVNKPLPPSNPTPLLHQYSLPNFPSQNLPLTHQQSFPNQQFHPSLSMPRTNSAPPHLGAPIMANNLGQPGMGLVHYNSVSPAAGGFQQAGGIQQFQTPAHGVPTMATPAPTPGFVAQHQFAGGPRPIMANGVYGPQMMPAQQQNTLGNQIACSIANGIASGASQALAQEIIPGIFGSGGGGGGNGGGEKDMTGFSSGADVVSVDQSSYSDGSFGQVDGGYEGGGVDASYS
ncbi:OLC1v1001661C1 [Oldenlandia corymbosa var. corymbosa]|uniref:OLC1v1001661C1 n=1 Tax=Oldenlandia corymbosa var. corymbosa TaxID=529605 RepID=A0AAV1D8K7_OLDCO|nr:OLC1v1001661C1 [Oldenlandia corymbosa var. corymbosa]